MTAELGSRAARASEFTRDHPGPHAVEIHGLSASKLRQWEVFPGVRLGDKPIRLPDNLLAPSQRNHGLQLIDIGKAIPPAKELNSDRIEEIEATMMRMMLAALLIPRIASGRRGTLIKPSTWSRRCKELIHLTRWALQNRPHTQTILAHLTIADLARCVSECAVYGRTLVHFTQLYELGAISDWPKLRFEDAQEHLVEKSRKTDGRPALPAKTSRTRWQPLPDDFISEVGWRCLWFAENVGPSLIALHRELRALECLSPKRQERLANKIIANWEWRSPSGEKLGELPFSIDVRGQGRRSHCKVTDIRKITRRAHVFSLARSLQIIHGLIIAICMAPRISETLGLTTRSLSAVGNRVKGKTYKLVDDPQGHDRDWPVHEVAAAAFLAQIDLTAPIRKEDEESLFVLFVSNNRGGEISERGRGAATLLYDNLATLFDLRPLLQRTNFHSHRIRKTMVRLAGLALVSAPKILMDLLGHRRIKMTLDYMLSDPAFTAEVQAVAQKLVRLQVTEIASSSEGHGGKAGERLSAFLSERRGRRGELALDVEDLREAATVISLNGLAWQVVRPGVICIKAPFEQGPCTKSSGAPDPGSCSSVCDYRLEEARLRADVDECISESLSEYARAREAGDEILSSFWRGQVRAHLPRFKDLEQQWADHPLVQEIRAWEARVQGREPL